MKNVEVKNGGKWFFPLQEQVKEAFNKEFGFEDYSCNYQDVTSTRVHENYTVTKDGERFIMHVVLSKGVNDGAIFYYKSL